jgi:hypothetical protein
MSTTDESNETNINNLALGDDGELPDLSDFGKEPSSGPWEHQGFGPSNNWYPAEVIEGYATASSFQWTTEDTASKDGASRNMRVCFRVTNSSNETRNIWASFNYRLDDFSARKLSAIKELREQYAGKKGAWAEKDLQRTSLAVASLGQFERAFDKKVRLSRTEAGNLNPGNLTGYKIDVRLGVNEDGYNTVEEYARLGERTVKKGKSA